MFKVLDFVQNKLVEHKAMIYKQIFALFDRHRNGHISVDMLERLLESGERAAGLNDEMIKQLLKLLKKVHRRGVAVRNLWHKMQRNGTRSQQQHTAPHTPQHTTAPHSTTQ